MKPKPTPKKELVVGYAPGLSNVLRIYTMSRDADEFVSRQCRSFGELVEPSKYNYHWWIHLHPTYDPEEVKAYIESYNDPA